MFFNPYFMRTLNYFRTEEKSYIRILHASPDAPAVDVYANDNLVAENLTYKEFTEYKEVPPGEYAIKVYPAGKKNNPIIDTKLSIPNESIYTVAASGNLSDIKLIPTEDPILPMEHDKTYVRFIHLSPNTPNVDITLPNGTVLFDDVGFEEKTDYIAVDPGIYTLNARPAGSDDVALTIPNIKLKPDRFYSVYAVGLLGNSPPLQVLIPLDGNSYIDF